MTFVISAATTVPAEITNQSDALAALDAALDLRERGCSNIKITDTRSGKSFRPAEFASAVGSSAEQSRKSA